MPTSRRRGTGQKIRLLGASEHNLKDVDVSIPLNMLTCVTGVSGSGKSTLVHDVLYAAIKRAKGGWEKRVGALPAARRRRAHHRRRARRSGADRTDAAFESGDISEGVRSDSRAVCRHQGCARRAGCRRAISRSTCRAGAAKRARAKAKSASRCSFSPTSSCRAINATASDSSRRCSRSATAGGTFIRCST